MKFNFSKISQDDQLLATVVPASEAFGVLSKRLDLPPYWAALSISRHGEHVFWPAGSVIDNLDIEELLLVRSTSMPLEFEVTDQPSSDGYPCDFKIILPIDVLSELDELTAFRSRLVGSRTLIMARDLQSSLEPAVRRALSKLISSINARDLLKPVDADKVAASIQQACGAILFESGLKACAPRIVSIDSKTYRQTERYRNSIKRRHEDQTSQSQLRTVINSAQHKHLDHLQDVLQRLDEMAEQSPEAKFEDLLRTFDESQRGALYEGLWSLPASGQQTLFVVVASGQDLIYFDPQDLSTEVRRVALDSSAGALRSIGRCIDADGRSLLLVGAATGAHLLDANTGQSRGIFLSNQVQELRGGFNSITIAGNHILGSHSELGLLCWHINHQQRPASLCPHVTSNAESVRCVQFIDGRLWFAADCVVYCLRSLEALTNLENQATVIGFSGSRAPVTALAWFENAILAGNAAGDLLEWRVDHPDHVSLLRKGNGRAVESLSLISTKGIDRLFFTDTSTAVHARVRGDAFSCRYEAGGQTLRRAEFSADWIVATNEARDRLLCWPTTQPANTPTVVHVSQLTRRSIQDVCLVPDLHENR